MKDIKNFQNGLKLVQNQLVFVLLTETSRQRKAIFNAVLWSFCAGVILSVAATWLTYNSPSVGEIVQNTIITAGAWALIFASMFFGAIIVIGFTRSAVRVWKEESERMPLLIRRELPAALPTFDLGNDVLIVRYPGDDSDTFLDKVEAARRQTTADRWVVVFQFRNPWAAIYTQPGVDDIVFSREDPPFQAADWPDEYKVAQPGQWFSDESEKAFADYVAKSVPYLREWLPMKKITVDMQNAGRTVLNLVRHSANVLLFVLFASGLFAQKAEQVSATPVANQVPASGQQIAFIFAQSDIYRTADGQKTYLDLLKNTPMFRDGGGGKLVAIMAGQKSVWKANQTGEVAAAKTRDEIMRGTAETSAPVEYSLPDSTTSAEMAERVKYQIWLASQQAGKMARPWWEVVMYAFGIALPLFIVGIALGRFASEFFAEEGMLREHKIVRAWLAILVVITVGVGLLEVLLLSMWAGMHPVALSVLALLEAWLANRLAGWLVPDFRPSAGNAPGEYSARPGLPGLRDRN